MSAVPDMPPPVVATAYVEGNRVVLMTPFSLKDAIKEIDGRLWDGDLKHWHIPATPAAVGKMRAYLRDPARGGDPTVGLNCDAKVIELMEKFDRANEAGALKDAEELPPIPGVPPSGLNPESGGWNHQRQAYWFARELDACMLAMWMGTGKSLVAVRLFDAWEANLVIVLCPVRVIRVWHRELRKWSDRGWIVASGIGCDVGRRSSWGRTRWAQKCIERGRIEGRPVAVVVNYEASWQGYYKNFLPALGADVVVMDESQKIKAPGGTWSKYAAKVAQKAPKRLAMTGTPMPSGPTALYGQFRALDPGIFGTNYRRYQARYFEMGGYEDREVQGFLDRRAAEAHADAMASIAYICDKSVLDLPPEMDLPAEDFTVEMSEETAERYRELEADFVTYVDALVSCGTCGGSGEFQGAECKVCGGAGAVERSGAVVAANVLAKLMRLAQVTSGFLPVEAPGGEVELVDLGTEKIELLEETIVDLGCGPEEPVVVFCRFRRDLQRLREMAKRLGLRHGEISGRTSDALTEDAEMRPDVDLVGVQLQAGGLGIDLTRSRYAIFYSMDFNLGDYQQSRERVHRPGQTRETFYIFPTVRGSIDEVVQEAMLSKENVVKACIRAAKESGRIAVSA